MTAVTPASLTGQGVRQQASLLGERPALARHALGFEACDWKTSVMLVGVVIAVVGVAAAFFTGATLAIAGFALLGVSSGLGYFFARSSLNKEELEYSIRDLHTHNTELQMQMKNVERIVGTLTTQNMKLKERKKETEAGLTKLKDHNAALQSAQESLQLSYDDLASVAGSMREENSSFRERIETLEEVNGCMQAAIREFALSNKAFTRSALELKSTVDSLTEAEVEMKQSLERLDESVESNIDQLSRDLTIHRSFVQGILSYFAEKKEVLTVRVQDFQRVLDEAKDSEIRYREAISALTEVNRELDARVAALEGSARSLADTRGKMHADVEELDTLQGEMRVVTAALAAEGQKLVQIRRDLATATTEAERIIAGLDVQIKQRETQLTLLNRIVLQKLGQLNC